MKNTKLTNAVVSKRDTILWIAMAAMIALTVAVNHYFFFNKPIAIRSIVWIIVALILMLLFFYTTRGQRLWEFGQASRAELRKVVWPTREETVRTTLIVMAMVTVSGLFLWGIDTLLLWAVTFLTG